MTDQLIGLGDVGAGPDVRLTGYQRVQSDYSAKSDDLSAGAAASFTTFHSLSFTPNGTAIFVDGTCCIGISSGSADIRVQLLVGATAFGGLRAANLASHFNLGRALKVTGLTAGVAVTIALQYKAVAGTVNCRCSTQAEIEHASIRVRDA